MTGYTLKRGPNGKNGPSTDLMTCQGFQDGTWTCENVAYKKDRIQDLATKNLGVISDLVDVIIDAPNVHLKGNPSSGRAIVEIMPLHGQNQLDCTVSEDPSQNTKSLYCRNKPVSSHYYT